MTQETHVLVADPDPAERGLLRRALQRSGRRVHLASGSQAVMRHLAGKTPEAVIVADRRADSECPDLISWIRTASAQPGIPIVALAPHHNQDLTARCYQAGADLVVSTPLDIDAFALALAALLRRTGTVSVTIPFTTPRTDAVAG